MDCYDARLQSFRKAKRVKQKNTTVTLKWPHPDTHAATPEQLAEAGFYYDPSPEHRDNVTCFMCRKELDEWDEDDDPLLVHFARCKDICAWAVARCGNAEDLNDNGSFAFRDPVRAPTSKTMEKARAETFATGWPHDTVKGHGANSKKMAKAGFLYAPHSPGDDTAICVYCTTTLSGWDDDDDPLEEHRKRVMKSGRRCAFFELLEGPSKPASRSTSKLASRSTSQAMAKIKVGEAEEDLSSEDELVVSKPKAPKRSVASRASSVPAKTPASRKSTRSGGTTGSRATGTRGTVASETEEDVEASGTDAGKRVSKSKRKAATKGKEKIGAIEEEEEEENILLPEEPVVQKPRRGRPPGKTKAAKAKKSPVETAAQSDLDPVPHTRKPSRARSKANVESEAEPVAADKPASQSKQKSSVKAMKAAPVVEVPLDRPSPQPEAGGHDANIIEGDTQVMPPPKSRPKGRTISVVKSKGKAIEIESDNEAEQPQTKSELPLPILPPSSAIDKTLPKNRKSSTTSDDAGYATAEQPMEVDDGDEPLSQQHPERPLAEINEPTHPSVKQEPPLRTATKSPPIDVEMADRPRPMGRDSGLARSIDLTSVRPPPKRAPKESFKLQTRASSRPTGSLARPPSRIGTEIVDISSDDEDELDVLKTVSIPDDKMSAEKVDTLNTSSLSKTSNKAVRSLHSRHDIDMLDSAPAGSAVPHPVPPAAVMKPKATKEDAQNEVPTVPVVRIEPIVHESTSDTRDVEMDEPEMVPAVDHSHSKAFGVAQQNHRERALDSIERVSSPATLPPQTPPLPPSEATTAYAAPPAPLPSFDADLAAEKQRVDARPHPAVEAFMPFLSMLPMSKLTALSDEEANLSLEQFIRRELERQYQQLKEDGERQISRFKQRAAEARTRIEDL